MDSNSNWICKNEAIDLQNMNISKNDHVKRTSSKIHFKKFISKNDNILLVIKSSGNFEISLLKFIKKK